MFIVLFLFTAAVFLYRYYSAVNSKWAQRGIRGPKPSLLFGNIREIWNFDKPRALVLRDWSKQFGKVYGFYDGQRPFIVVSDYEIANEIIAHKFDHFYARARFLHQPRVEGPRTRILQARGAHWKRLRTLGSAAFTPKSLRNVLQTIETSTDTLADGIEKYQGEINALTFFQEYTLCIICKIALGMHDVEMFNNQYFAALHSFFMRSLRHPVNAFPALFPFAVDEIDTAISFLAKLGVMKSPFAVLMQMLTRNVKERKAQRAKDTTARDFIDIFLNAEVDTTEVESETAKKLSLDEVMGLCFTFLIAGYDEVQKRLTEEVDAFLEENKIIDISSLNRLPYMDAVINESLRHYPQSTSLFSRECVKACEINGVQFEVGDMIAMDTWTMHMDEAVWGEDAKEFRPERWLEESPRPRSAFQSFGAGPRICLGMRLVYIEEKLAFLKLLSRFTIEKTANTNPLKLVGSLIVNPEKVMVKFIKR